MYLEHYSQAIDAANVRSIHTTAPFPRTQLRYYHHTNSSRIPLDMPLRLRQ